MNALAATREGLLVLVAEDTPANQKFAQYVLQEQGFRVALADNGRQAVEMVARQRYDAILMDLQMPVMDGLEATATIRAAGSAQPRVPIIAISAHPAEDEEKRCLAAGMDGYLTKPLNAARMRQMIAEICARRASGGP